MVQLEKVLKFLSKESVETLSREEFRIEVPPEFENGTKAVIGPALKPIGAGRKFTDK